MAFFFKKHGQDTKLPAFDVGLARTVLPAHLDPVGECEDRQMMALVLPFGYSLHLDWMESHWLYSQLEEFACERDHARHVDCEDEWEDDSVEQSYNEIAASDTAEICLDDLLSEVGFDWNTGRIICNMQVEQDLESADRENETYILEKKEQLKNGRIIPKPFDRNNYRQIGAMSKESNVIVQRNSNAIQRKFKRTDIFNCPLFVAEDDFALYVPGILINEICIVNVYRKNLNDYLGKAMPIPDPGQGM